MDLFLFLYLSSFFIPDLFPNIAAIATESPRGTWEGQKDGHFKETRQQLPFILSCKHICSLVKTTKQDISYIQFLN